MNDPTLVEAALNGSRVFLLQADGTAIPLGDEADGTLGLDFRPSSSCPGVSTMVNVLPGTGLTGAIRASALDGKTAAIEQLSVVFAEGQFREHGGPASPSPRPTYVAAVGSDDEYRLSLALCHAAARKTGGDVKEAVSRSTSFRVPAPGAKRAAARAAFQGSTLYNRAAGLDFERPIFVVTATLRDGDAIDAAKRALAAAAPDGNPLEVKGLALFRAVGASHKRMTDRELLPTVLASRGARVPSKSRAQRARESC